MVTIVASYNVTPNQPTPKDPLWLSDSDLIGNLGHISVIYIYKAKHNTDTIERLRNSLSKILVYFYPVAGRLNLTKSGRIEVDCNAKGVRLLEAETTKTFGDYGDFSPSESTEELVPKVDNTQPREEIPLLLLQLTRFLGGDEGLAIGVTFAHPLIDATGLVHFINSWAKLARGEALEPNEMPFLNRTILKFQHQPSSSQVLGSSETEFDPHKQDLEKPIAQTPLGVERKKVSATILKLTSSHLERLKKKANDQPSKEGSRPYTRFEVVAAHIWRCASKARESGENHPTLVTFSVNFRNRLNPPLPQNYFGNALAKVVTPECYEGDIISNPLGFAAQKIREAAQMVTDESIRSQLHASLGQGQLNHIRAFFTGHAHSINNPFDVNHSIFLTSWMNMPVYESDFGWEKPLHFGIVSRAQVDRATILPSPDGDGVVITIFFQTALMELFLKFFFEDMDNMEI
ncbi:hypothetical protein AAZX31_15G227200 [Glycine max]